MKSKIFLLVIGVILAVLFCAQLGGYHRALAAAGPTPALDHPLKVKHAYDSNGDVIWGIRDNKGKKAFHLHVQTNQFIVEWTNINPKETNMSIIVNNSNHWGIQGTFGPPMYGLACTTCGQVDTQNGTIQLKFLGDSNTTIYYYTVVVPPQGRIRQGTNDPDPDMVAATIVWNPGIENDKHKRR
jgi:hypothetical protein